ncbi:MAG: hypothetical protein AAB633_00885, partial [Patescibacteria group bacterium]
MLSILAVIALILPYFARPFAFDLDPDTGLLVMHMMRLVDGAWNISVDPNLAYQNPFVLLLIDFHGMIRQLVFFPLMAAMDAVGVRLTPHSVGALFVSVGIALTILNYYFLRTLLPRRIAGWAVILLAVMPFYAAQLKGGWWHVFVYPLALLALFGMHRWVREGWRPGRALLWCAIAALLLTDTGFIFSYFLIALYALVLLRESHDSLRAVVGGAWRLVRSWWIVAPLSVGVGSLAVTLLGRIKFDAPWGVMARFFEKGAYLGVDGFGVLPHFLVQGMGLTGWVLFPLMVVACGWWLYRMARRRYAAPFVQASAWFFVITVVLLLIAHGPGGAVYVLYLPGAVLVTAFIAAIRPRFLAGAVFALVVFVTYGQTLMYLTERPPPPWLTRSYTFLRPNEPCRALWCPWHFTKPRNLGMTTAAFVMRDYLDIQPIPFVSIRENFAVRPKEIFFYTEYGQGPSVTIGRRIAYRIEDLENPKLILLLTDAARAQAPDAMVEAENKKVFAF